jgi:hypothetical protein
VLGAAAAAVVAAGVGSYLALAQTGSSPPAGSGHRVAAHTASTPRWRPYTDPSGFSISLPPGWRVTSTAPDERDFTGTPQGFAVVVAWTDTPKSDALADWQQQAQAKAATDPGYQLISISRATYRSYNAADWQFTDLYKDTGSQYQYLDRGFIVRPGQLAYAIELYGPAGQWSAEYAKIWQGLMTSFRPAS